MVNVFSIRHSCTVYVLGHCGAYAITCLGFVYSDILVSLAFEGHTIKAVILITAPRGQKK